MGAALAVPDCCCRIIGASYSRPPAVPRLHQVDWCTAPQASPSRHVMVPQVCLSCENPNNMTVLRDGKCVPPCKDTNCQTCASPDADTCDECFNGEALPSGVSLAKWGWPCQVQFHTRSEKHTSEIQSHHELVFRLLLEKKKKKS